MAKLILCGNSTFHTLALCVHVRIVYIEVKLQDLPSYFQGQSEEIECDDAIW